MNLLGENDGDCWELVAWLEFFLIQANDHDHHRKVSGGMWSTKPCESC